MRNKWCHKRLKEDEKLSTTMSVELISVGALLTHARSPRGKVVTTRLNSLPGLVAHTLGHRREHKSKDIIISTYICSLESLKKRGGGGGEEEREMTGFQFYGKVKLNMTSTFIY